MNDRNPTSPLAAPRFGVNYVPSESWWYSWQDWNDDSIHEDLKTIASMGMDHLRIHCLWPCFQPNANIVSEAALDKLQRLLDIAGEHGLDVEVTVLDGWLSGFLFFPSWVGQRNMFTDADVIAAEKKLFRAINDRIGNHPAFLGYDLGNELGVLMGQGHPATPSEADLWQTDMLALCEEIAPGKLHVNGVDHIHWFHDVGFTRSELATTGAATSLHGWIEFTGARGLFGPHGDGSVHLVEYCIELARAYHTDLTRPIWMQEFGATREWMAEDTIPDFAEATIRNAMSCGNVWGFTWWCSHDLSPRLAGFSPLELDLGLIDSNNKVKPVGARVAALISEFRDSSPPVISRPQALVLPDDLFAVQPDPMKSPGWSFGEPYMKLISEGIRPSVVLESRAGDKEYLKERGITELIRL